AHGLEERGALPGPARAEEGRHIRSAGRDRGVEGKEPAPTQRLGQCEEEGGVREAIGRILPQLDAGGTSLEHEADTGATISEHPRRGAYAQGRQGDVREASRDGLTLELPRRRDPLQNDPEGVSRGVVLLETPMLEKPVLQRPVGRLCSKASPQDREDERFRHSGSAALIPASG